MDAIEAKLQTHEEICTMRCEQINARLKRIESILLSTAGLLLVGMATIISNLFIEWRG